VAVDVTRSLNLKENDMRTTKRLLQVAAFGAVTIGTVAVAVPDTRIGKRARRLAARLDRDLRYAVASSPGLLYRLAGRHPDPYVPDDILANRIRSRLGPLERRLDVPRVHVEVDDHVAILHGDVGNAFDAARLELATSEVSGVFGVESHLHHGLLPGDTRPSEGARNSAPSSARAALTTSAREAGADDPERAVHAVLCTFSERIPLEERAHLMGHLPADARALMQPPTRRGAERKIRTVPELVAATAAAGELTPDTAQAVTRAVLTTLRSLVPEEAQDIAAVLPAPLWEFWMHGKARVS
jgi:uncharacterized protein (DUF2267 family)